jgi:hypothetical protein
MAEISKEVIQELIHLNAYRRTESPMQAAHEALFRAKVIEFADGLIQAAIEREELSARLAKTELCLKEAIEAMNDIKDAVSAA